MDHGPAVGAAPQHAGPGWSWSGRCGFGQDGYRPGADSLRRGGAQGAWCPRAVPRPVQAIGTGRPATPATGAGTQPPSQRTADSRPVAVVVPAVAGLASKGRVSEGPLRLVG